MKDLPLAGREILPENTIDEFPHQMEVGDFLDFGAIYSGKAFAQGAGLTV